MSCNFPFCYAGQVSADQAVAAAGGLAPCPDSGPLLSTLHLEEGAKPRPALISAAIAEGDCIEPQLQANLARGDLYICINENLLAIDFV